MTLIYISDPMCSWCYGFSPEIDKILSTFEELEIHVVMGGLRAGGTQSINSMKDFLKEHWTIVSERSGQQFSYDILDNPSLIYDTEPACRAIVSFRYIQQENTFEFLKEAQKLFYLENKDTSVLANYLPILEKFDIHPKVFSNTFESEKTKKMTRDDFEWVQKLGVHGFPYLMLEIKGEYYTLAKGYLRGELIIQKIYSILGKDLPKELQ